jgi:hypothetical protein
VDAAVRNLVDKDVLELNRLLLESGRGRIETPRPSSASEAPRP